MGGGVRPLQTLSCGTSNGALQFTHRWATSAAVPWDATPDELALALSNIATIGIIRVTPQPVLAAGVWVTPAQICSGIAEHPTILQLSFVHDAGVVEVLSVENLGSDNNGEAIITLVNLGSTPTYGADVTLGATWDADKLQGCHCDGYPEWNSTSTSLGMSDRGSWLGPACATRACPTGINPYGVTAVNEVQRITCNAGSGSFTLSFRGQTTLPIDFDVTIDELKDALQDLVSIGLVDVTFESGDTSDGAAVTRVCGWASDEPRMVLIRFVTELGDVPLLKIDSSRLFGPSPGTELATLFITEVIPGAGDVLECSGQGSCDETTGLCTCFDAWLSSNGAGAEGRRGDCSARRGN